MINATESILLFNAYTDESTRRKAYRVTRINGVSAHEVAKDSDNGGYAALGRVMSVRVPYTHSIGQSYYNEAAYDLVADKAGIWTVRTQDYFIVLIGGPETIPETLYEDDIKALAKKYGYQARAYKITEYADNTRRGRPATQHIRIIGE